MAFAPNYILHHIPTEIWLIVLGFVYDSASSIANVASVCTYFNHLVRGHILFRHLTFGTFGESADLTLAGMILEEPMRRERVRDVKLRYDKWPPHQRENEPWAKGPTDIHPEITHLMSSMKNLQSLRMWNCFITLAVVDMCERSPPNFEGRSLRLKDVLLTRPDEIGESDLQALLGILCPPTIEFVDLKISTLSSSSAQRLCSQLSAANLRGIAFSMINLDARVCQDFLSSQHDIEIISNYGLPDDFRLPPSALPGLRVYRGGGEDLPMFMPGRPVDDITVIHSERVQGDIKGLERIFESIKQASVPLRALSLSLYGTPAFSAIVLEMILQSFPMLEKLELLGLSDRTPEEFLETTFTEEIPQLRWLEELNFRWARQGDLKDLPAFWANGPSADEVLWQRELVVAWGRCCPELRSVQFFMVEWIRVVDDEWKGYIEDRLLEFESAS